MPYVDGESLRDRLTREKPLPIADAVRIASEVASALDYAHRHGVIHRDTTPENILLHGGTALVADFGIALAVLSARSERMTQTGLSLGTPHYMGPQQAMGEKQIDARSDVYSLGAALSNSAGPGTLIRWRPPTAPTRRSGPPTDARSATSRATQSGVWMQIATPALHFRAPRWSVRLFGDQQGGQQNTTPYDVSPDGMRFLVRPGNQESAPAGPSVNWQQLLGKSAATGSESSHN